MTWRRRIVSIPAVVLGAALLTALAPLVLLGAFVADLLRPTRRFPMTRLVVFGWLYLLAETVGLCALGLSWLVTLGRPGARLAQTYAIQRVWAETLFGALRAVFGVAVSLDEGDAALSTGPYVVMMRHASIVDTLFPSAVLAGRHHRRLRYVLKAELLADPCLDVAGNRLPNVFVRRGRAGADVPAVAALAEGLAEDDAVVIYPEGTRFTEAKRDRLVRRGGRIAERAAALRHTLPPRPGGPGALLRAGHDVVFLAHRGLEGLAGIRDLLDGALVGLSVSVAAWRVSASEVDLERVDEWLFDQWLGVDAWVGAHAAAD